MVEVKMKNFYAHNKGTHEVLEGETTQENEATRLGQRKDTPAARKLDRKARASRQGQLRCMMKSAVGFGR